jgi:hypothetical protein
MLKDALSTEAFIECTSGHPAVGPFWDATGNAIAQAVRGRVQGVEDVRVRLFAMDGMALGTAA